MINILRIFIAIMIPFFAISCSQILETVDMTSFSDEQILNAELQEEFDVNLKTLTLNEANKNKNAPYPRTVMVDGSGSKANVYSETILLKSLLPPASKPQTYVLGIGDQLSFVQLHDANLETNSINMILGDDASSILDPKDNLITSNGRIGSDGSILLLGLGRLNASGRTINDLRLEVRNILIRKGSAPNFQLEITSFQSRKAFVFTPNGGNGVVPITESPLTLKELVARGGYVSQANVINLITLTRGEKIYRISNNDLFDEQRPEIFIQDKDQIKLETFPYKPGQVYALNGGVSAAIIPISPSKRETLADVMFMPAGPISNDFSRRSEIYLLRGEKPITAYHLDAQNASRIIVAAAMELRPKDIIYTAQRPIISFSKLLQEVTPLRILLRDIQDGNIP